VHAVSRRWQQLCEQFGAPSRRVHATWHEIQHAYREPQRRFHTLEHLGEVLVLIDMIVEPSLPARSLELAAWLHDLVYDPMRTDNETASAGWAREHLPTLGVDDVIVTEVCDLIMMTIDHDPVVTDPHATALCDADLAVLGAPPRRYERYAADVRWEYVDLSDDEWRVGRRRVLESFLSRPHLYHHASLRTWDSRARRNMSSELTRLGFATA
jgi:predicted metal-dependent HD superfamily phosphohydrolase